MQTAVDPNATAEERLKASYEALIGTLFAAGLGTQVARSLGIRGKGVTQADVLEGLASQKKTVGEAIISARRLEKVFAREPNSSPRRNEPLFKKKKPQLSSNARPRRLANRLLLNRPQRLQEPLSRAQRSCFEKGIVLL